MKQKAIEVMVKHALEMMASSAVKAFQMDRELRELGYRDTPYFEIGGEIADAIYYLLGEKTNTFDESTTFNVLYNDSLTSHDRTEILLAEWRRNVETL